jgi:hypothetical protein
MCVRIIHRYSCGHGSDTDYAPCRYIGGLCSDMKSRLVEHDEKCDDCDELEDDIGLLKSIPGSTFACQKFLTAKIRCDGKSPACGPCQRSNRASDCSLLDRWTKNTHGNVVAAPETVLQRHDQQAAETQVRGSHPVRHCFLGPPKTGVRMSSSFSSIHPQHRRFQFIIIVPLVTRQREKTTVRDITTLAQLSILKHFCIAQNTPMPLLALLTRSSGRNRNARPTSTNTLPSFTP